MDEYSELICGLLLVCALTILQASIVAFLECLATDLASWLVSPRDGISLDIYTEGDPGDGERYNTSSEISVHRP
jgi:hypothetical protein